MESRIFPDWDHIKNFHNPLTDGEKTLLIYLDNNLPKDSNWKVGSPLSEYHGWLIFVQPYLNGSRPDIILFNPYVGIQIIEVKDWNLKCYGITYNKDKKQSEMYATNKEYSYTIKRPDKQVE
ncbi:MAG TPA: NERD domain-containing protein, partial [Candidatus Cloacimonadota bacterium]|nr:NERD domain-containing protein [Candidatus Cloacimonadota bacterium]